MISTFIKISDDIVVKTSVIIKVIDFDNDISDIITKVFFDCKGIDKYKLPDNLSKEKWDLSIDSKPALIKIAGFCSGGVSESYWAIYISGIGLLIFEDPTTISKWCNVYLWSNYDDRFKELFVIRGFDDEPLKIKSLPDSNKNTKEVSEEFFKYFEWDDDSVYLNTSFEKLSKEAAFDPNNNEYIFDPDKSFDFDIISEISKVWPLKEIY